MIETLVKHLREIQPSQLYVSAAKLARVMELLAASGPEALDPLPVKKLGGHVIFTDGHTRALATLLSGFTEVSVFWDEDDLDWEAYAICVRWCRAEGISSIADLQNRVISAEAYEVLWLDRCREMHRELETKHGAV